MFYIVHPSAQLRNGCMDNFECYMSDIKKYTVRRAAPGMGLGLFAAAPIKEGEFIVEYTGERITTEEADRRLTRYLFEIDENYTIDGAVRDNDARYINHFCEPNAEVELEDGHINIYALRDIAAGEEIGYDYGEEYIKEFIAPTGCKCTTCVR